MKTKMPSPMPSWRTHAAIALFPLILINCAGTVTRQLDAHDPVAYASAVNDMKSTNTEIALRSGAVYRGVIGNVGSETMELITERGYTKIPMNDVASVSLTDHGVGAAAGMGWGVLWTGGIFGLLGAPSGNFGPAFLSGALLGGTIGLISGAIGGAHVVYQFPNNGTQQTQSEPAPSQIIDTAKTKTRNDRDTASGDKTTKTIPAEIQTPQPVAPSPIPEEVLISLEDLGKIRILLKNGSEKNSCSLRAVHARSIEYEKNGVLHDLAIEDILRIETNIDGRTRGVVLEANQKIRLTQ